MTIQDMPGKNKTKLHLIINPNAGGGIQSNELAWIENQCFEHGHQIYLTERPKQASEIAGEIIKNEVAQIVVAVGGDGTVSEVAHQLIHSPHILGIIPRGSGNGLAGHLNLPNKLNKAYELIINGTARKMDVLKVNGRISCNTSGAGFDGWVAKNFGQNGQRGLFNYLRLGLGGYHQYKSHTIQYGGKAYQNILSLEIANSSQLGNKAYISPRSSIQDGKAELIFLEKPPYYAVPGILWKTFNGTLDQSSYIRVIEVQSGRIDFIDNLEWHIDGEFMGMTNQLDFEIIPNALNIVY